MPVDSADLIRIPAASSQSITFHCLQDCSTSSTAYLAIGCDNSTGHVNGHVNGGSVPRQV